MANFDYDRVTEEIAAAKQPSWNRYDPWTSFAVHNQYPQPFEPRFNHHDYNAYQPQPQPNLDQDRYQQQQPIGRNRKWSPVVGANRVSPIGGGGVHVQIEIERPKWNVDFEIGRRPSAFSRPTPAAPRFLNDCQSKIDIGDRQYWPNSFSGPAIGYNSDRGNNNYYVDGNNYRAPASRCVQGSPSVPTTFNDHNDYYASAVNFVQDRLSKIDFYDPNYSPQSFPRTPTENANYDNRSATATYFDNECPQQGTDDDIDIDDPQNWPELFQRPKRTPPANYICHNCYAPADHFVNHCPRHLPEGVKCSPYQGSKACIGEFDCRDCKRSWLSHRSFSNVSEKCKKCKNEVFPKKQHTEKHAIESGLYEKPKYAKYKAKFLAQAIANVSTQESMNVSTSDSGSSIESWSTSD